MPGELAQSHAKYEKQCDKCHGDDDADQRGLCLDCHDKIAEDVRAKMGFHGKSSQVAVGENCRTCHSDHRGRDFAMSAFNNDHFDHRNTDFVLQGKHQALTCDACHKPDELARDAPTECVSCHRNNDVHKGNLGELCADCHSEERWTEPQFAHDETDFPLKGAHRDAKCQSCHIDQKMSAVSSECSVCHASADVHQGNNGAQCGDCHGNDQWSDTEFNHTRDTQYPLQGAHKQATCGACHQDKPLDEPLNTRCRACHGNDDVHLGSLGPRCESCHKPEGWGKATFDHEKTRFALQGVHADLSCAACHQVHESAIDSAVTCRDCHASDDPHDAGLGERCETCHSQQKWSDKVQFNHDLTAFPLSGMHAASSCDACHFDGEYRDMESECIACHEIDNRHEGMFSEKCDGCHNPNSWQLVSFDHDASTKFALTGGHADRSCADCHNAQIASAADQTPTDCFSCHSDDDPHRRKFGRQCENCHITESFSKIRIWRDRQ